MVTEPVGNSENEVGMGAANDRIIEQVVDEAIAVNVPILCVAFINLNRLFQIRIGNVGSGVESLKI